MAGYAKVIALAVAVVSSALAISIFAIPFLASPQAETDGNGADVRRLVVIVDGRGNDPTTFKHIKPSDNIVQVNSMQWTLDPFGRSMRAFYDAGINGSTTEEKNAWVASMDAQERYMLVRLPGWQGGDKNDFSAYRAYSAFDIASHCTIRYWGGDRMLIQDPCHSNGYRAWDGLTMHGVSTYGGSGGAGLLFSPAILALPQMRLGIDGEGYIVAYRPDNSLYGDGVVGEGKRFTPEQMKESNEKMIQTISKHAGFELPFPATVSDRYPVWVVPKEEDSGFAAGLFFIGHSFEGYEYSAIYQPRPVPNTSNPNYRMTVFANETFADSGHAKVAFDGLFGAESPECNQGCRFVVRQGDNIVARVDTEAGAEDLNAEALVWGKSGGQDVMVAIEGINSGMNELMQVANSLDFD